MRVRYFFSIFILWMYISCSSNTKLTSSWKNEKAPHKKYNKIMVFGIIREKDRSMREQLEKNFVDDLKAMGYNAVSAIEEYGPKAFERVPEDQVADRLHRSGYDAVITVSILDKQKDTSYTPSTVQYQPYNQVYYSRFGRYYTTVYDRVYTPGYYSTDTKYFLESNLYDIATGDLIYSGQTKSFDPSSSEALASDNSKKILKDMKQQKLLGK
ncbi:MAG: hypothetical protein ABJA78_11895 [Ferruginibacter sp.]